MIKLVDMHSHILPNIDDGSSSVENSIEMLRASQRNGVEKIVATPHFYPSENEIDKFLTDRAKSIALLKPHLLPSPKVYIGAEVAYYMGIGSSNEIKKLCILGTDFIIIEMPFSEWTDSVIKDIIDIKERLGLYPIIAHIERYSFMQSNKVLENLKENGILFQSNAEFLTEPKNSGTVKKYLKKEYIDLIGSDSHNLTDRKPNLTKDIEKLFKKKEMLEEICDFSNYMLENAKCIN